jgi:hypothetical protein
MSSPPPVPLLGEHGAPSFDSQHPHNLLHYFEDLKYLFSHSSIIDPHQQKFYIAYFVDSGTHDLWQSIPEYTEPSCDAEKFQLAISRLYTEVDCLTMCNGAQPQDRGRGPVVPK